MADYGSWRPGEEKRRRDAGRAKEGICKRDGKRKRRKRRRRVTPDGDEMIKVNEMGRGADFNQAGIINRVPFWDFWSLFFPVSR